MADSFPANWCARVGASSEVNYRLRKAQFGDGYQQVSGDGINNQSESWDIEFTGELIYISDISDWFDARSGQKSFFWKNPFGKTKLYRCEGYRTTALGNERFSLTCKFIEAFAP